MSKKGFKDPVGDTVEKFTNLQDNMTERFKSYNDRNVREKEIGAEVVLGGITAAIDGLKAITDLISTIRDAENTSKGIDAEIVKHHEEQEVKRAEIQRDLEDAMKKWQTVRENFLTDATNRKEVFNSVVEDANLKWNRMLEWLQSETDILHSERGEQILSSMGELQKQIRDITITYLKPSRDEEKQ